MAAIEKTTVLTSQGEQPDIVQRFLTNSALFIFLASSAEDHVGLGVSDLHALCRKSRIYLQLPQCDQYGTATNGGSI